MMPTLRHGEGPVIVWLITVDGGLLIKSGDTIQSVKLAAAVVGELILESVSLGGGATFSPGLMAKVEQAIFEDGTNTSYNPPIRVVLGSEHVVAMVEHYTRDRPVSDPARSVAS